MITTVTLSPCIDKTSVLETFDPEKVNRVISSRLDAGGKGVNVSLALASLNVKCRAVGLNFELGETIEDVLRGAGVDTDFIKCSGRLRTNLKIFVQDTKRTVEINEQNPEVSRENVGDVIGLCRRLARDKDNGIFVLAGSIPAGVPTDIYAQLIDAIKAEKPHAKIVLDAVGDPLMKGLSASPYMIKPNVEELEKSFGVTLLDDDAVVKLCCDIIAEYRVGLVLVSKGSDGAIAVTDTEAVSVPAIRVDAKSAQGAGDAMVAGACLAISKRLPPKDILRYGTCAAAGAVEREGTAFCTRERFDELLAEINRYNMV